MLSTGTFTNNAYPTTWSTYISVLWLYLVQYITNNAYPTTWSTYISVLWLYLVQYILSNPDLNIAII